MQRKQLLLDAAKLCQAHQAAVERFAAEIEFAQKLAEIENKRTWSGLIDRASQAVRRAIAGGRPERLPKAVERAEQLLAPVGKAAKKYTMHCVGHAHIDMNWMWSWPETVAVTNDTFLTVLKLMDEFEDFCFTQSQASVYAIARDYNPELFATIKRRIAEGRWEVAAVQWVEGDKNIVSGESLARHMLYTRQFCREELGLRDEQLALDWEPDTFGHAATIPSILAGGGVRRYYMCRGGAFEKPPVFWWRGPDGAKILVWLESTWYLNSIKPDLASKMLDNCRRTGLRDWMCVYGIGDHGGGPTRRDLHRIGEMDSWPIFPRIRFATAGGFYDVIERHGDKFPTLDRELNFEFTGCYTSQSSIKLFNRLGENQCLEAETAAALAGRVLGRPYPHQRLRDAWVNTLFGHFHDILPGSCVRASREYQSGLFQQTLAATGIVKTQSLRALAASIDTAFAGGGGASAAGDTATGAGAGKGTGWGGISLAGHTADWPRPFVAFNPCAHARHEVVRLTVWDPPGSLSADDLRNRSLVARMPDGRALPVQTVNTVKDWFHHYTELALPVDVSSLGHAAFAIEDGAAPAPADAVRSHAGSHGWEKQAQGALAMENEHLRVEFDALTGGIVQLLDKAAGIDLADRSRPMGILEHLVERPRGMSAWVVHDTMRRVCPIELQSFEVQDKGPYVVSMVAGGRINDSRATITYALRHGARQLDISIKVMWLERGTAEAGIPSLLMRFPYALADVRARYEIPFGSVQRDAPHDQEVPALRWADVTGRTAEGKLAGCALLNDSKYGHSLDGSTLRLRLMRSSYEPDPLPEIGEHNIRLALAPHDGKTLAADVTRLAAAFSHPLQVVSTGIHKGSLPPAAEALAVRPANVIVTAVKLSPDGAMVVRLLETSGKAAAATVTLNGDLLGKFSSAREVDLVERPLATSTVRLAGSGFAVKMPAHGIVTVELT